MRPLGELEDGLEANSLFARVSSARRFGTSARPTQCQNVVSGETFFIAFYLDMLGKDGDEDCWRFVLGILGVVGILNYFHQEPGSVRIQVG